MKTYWRGKDIEEMSREELIEALITMGQIYNNLIKSSQQMNATWSALARARD